MKEKYQTFIESAHSGKDCKESFAQLMRAKVTDQVKKIEVAVAKDIVKREKG